MRIRVRDADADRRMDLMIYVGRGNDMTGNVRPPALAGAGRWQAAAGEGPGTVESRKGEANLAVPTQSTTAVQDPCPILRSSAALLQ
jgi:hypothetical protein